MPLALPAVDYIFEGIWTNWEKGGIIGLTLTVNQYHAAIISPALAILIAIAGAQLWQLIQYALHQFRATAAPRNFFFHQQQVSLRNTPTDLNTLWRLVQLAIAWRHENDVHVLRNTLPLLFWALLHLVLVICAGLFSSTLLSAGDLVLSRSPWCGWFNDSYVEAMYAPGKLSDDTVKQIMEFSSYLNSAYAKIQQHVDICSTSGTDCDTLSTSTLNFTHTSVPGGCPFDSSICHPDMAGSMSFDTGYLSSFSDFGFNSVKEDRIAYRLVAECAPLNDAQHVSIWQDISATSDSPAYQIADAFYGTSSISERNATFSAVKQYSACEQRKVISPYTLSAQYAVAGGSVKTGTASFDPIQGLINDDADLGLVLMNFNGAYQGVVNDPWFSAKHVATDNTTYCDHEERTLYSRDLPITTIGCTQRWQMCNQDADLNMKADACTPLLSFYQLQRYVRAMSNSTLSLNPKQRATFNRIIQVSNGAFFHEVISHLSQSNTVPLQARHLMTRTVSLSLPENQWEIEAKYWFTILLTYLQQVSLQISTGQFAASTDYINRTEPSNTDKIQNAAYQICQNQIIRSRDYTNFNFFAMLFVIVFCILLIILGLMIEDVTSFIRQRQLRFKESRSKQDIWNTSSDIEMLRAISELQGDAVWKRSKNGVPVTRADHKIGAFDLSLGRKANQGEKANTETQDRMGLEHSRPSTRDTKRCTICALRTSPTDDIFTPVCEGHDSGVFGGYPRNEKNGKLDDGGKVIVYEHEIPSDPDFKEMSLGDTRPLPDRI